MRTMTKPSTMNPKQYDSHAGLANVRVSTSPAPFTQSLYPVARRGFRGSFDWCPGPGLF